MKSLLIALAISLLSTVACERRQGAADFVAAAALEDLYQARIAELGTTKGQVDGLKRFAERMAVDQQAREAALKATLVSEKMQIELPTMLSRADDYGYDQLFYTPADRFDQYFAKVETERLTELASLYERFAEHGDNEALKSYAREALPKIRERLQEAKDLPKALTPAKLVLS